MRKLPKHLIGRYQAPDLVPDPGRSVMVFGRCVGHGKVCQAPKHEAARRSTVRNSLSFWYFNKNRNRFQQYSAAFKHKKEQCLKIYDFLVFFDDLYYYASGRGLEPQGGAEEGGSSLPSEATRRSGAGFH